MDYRPVIEDDENKTIHNRVLALKNASGLQKGVLVTRIFIAGLVYFEDKLKITKKTGQ